ncbi:hypothetical protein [Flavobacterium sp.]|uniref:hypothetical protein n=1 Tax=Flavobacterium sp. TaxID=239 RepID=UPI0040476510
MEKSTALDVRTVFLNTTLFGTKSAPELTTDCYTSDLLISLLNIDNDSEKETLVDKISVNYLMELNKEERTALIDIICSNEIYNQFLFLVYRTFSKDKQQTEDNINFKIYEELMGYKNSGIITNTVLYYFKVMLDRLTIFDFAVPGKVSKEEYLKISSQLLSNTFDNYFLE